jgi:hypothetical protein
VGSKDDWNAERYTQIKAYVPKDIAAGFKKKCEAAGVSMSGVLIDCMRDADVEKPDDPDLSARKLRRRELRSVVGRLEKILEAEEDYMNRIPENLVGSVRHYNADRAVELLTDAVRTLEDVY